MNAKRRRTYYIVGILVIAAIGLSSRNVDYIPTETGDALWSMMVFCLIRSIFIKKKLLAIAIASLLISYADEFSQLIKWDWLNEIRRTTIGHLILGQGFLWEDILAYTIGIGIIYAVCYILEKKLRSLP